MDNFFWYSVLLRTDQEFLNLTDVDRFPDLLGQGRRGYRFRCRGTAPQNINQTAISLTRPGDFRGDVDDLWYPRFEGLFDSYK